MNTQKVKICLISSSGGHFEQLLRLFPLLNHHCGYIVTEDGEYDLGIEDYTVYRVPAINRTDKWFPSVLLRAFFSAHRILCKERPSLIISTGALAALPTLILGKLRGCKIVYIESFAKIDSPNKTGKIVYHFADRFYVQWESMIKYYPNALYKGGLY